MTTHTGLVLPRLTPAAEPVEGTYRRLARLTRAVMPFLGTTEWRNLDAIPTGGIICVCNHISHFDPLVLGLGMIYGGRFPRFLGKVQIFHSPWIGWLARRCGQIPVERGSVRAVDSLVAAEAAILEGKAVTLYPEGTLTSDPEGWPMSGRTGAARLALDTRAPVIPFGQWGAQFLMPDGKKGFPIVLGRRKKFQLGVGDPVDLSDLYDLPRTRQVLELATTRITDAVTAIVADLRGEEPPQQRWSYRTRKYEPVERSLPAIAAPTEDDPAANGSEESR